MLWCHFLRRTLHWCEGPSLVLLLSNGRIAAIEFLPSTWNCRHRTRTRFTDNNIYNTNSVQRSCQRVLRLRKCYVTQRGYRLFFKNSIFSTLLLWKYPVRYRTRSNISNLFYCSVHVCVRGTIIVCSHQICCFYLKKELP